MFGFAILFASRLITVILLAIANSGTLQVNAIIAYILAGLLAISSHYLFTELPDMKVIYGE